MKSEKLIALMALGVFAATAAAMAQTVAVGPVTHPTTGNRYYLLNTPSWTAAEAWAAARGGHLTSIFSAAENDWVRDSVLTVGGEPRKAYLGLNDAQTEGAFLWTNGQALSYTNWGPGEPDTASAMDYCVMFADGRWFARTNTGQQYAIAEFAGPIRVPQEFLTIQEAINAATNGMTILVGPGTYLERLNVVNKSLTIRGIQGAGSTIIDAQNSGTVIWIDNGGADGIVLDGLTIYNGNGAIYAGGLVIFGNNFIVKNCILHGNVGFYGGAIVTWFNGIITNCLFYNNESYVGAGVFAAGGAEISTAISNCTIINSPELGGHAIYSSASRVTARNCILRCYPVNLDTILPGEIDVAYCNTSEAVSGPGNSTVDPMLGPNYRLSAGSSCIDAGTNEGYPLLGFGAPFDCGAGGRFSDDPNSLNTGNGPGPIIDIGAFEFQPLPMTIGDMNGDGVVNGLDVAPFVSLLLL